MSCRVNSEIPEQTLKQTRLSLLRRLQSLDDQAGWNDFFSTYWKLIYGVARKAGLTDAEAQDVVQETVLTVAKNIGQFQIDRKRGSFRAWLLQITRWRIADQFRKRLPRADGSITEGTARTPTTERIPDPGSIDIAEVWERDWEQNLFDTALERVKKQVEPAEFQIFHLHVIKEMKAKDVAGKLEVKLANVYFTKYKVGALIKKEVRRLRSALL